MKKARDIVTTTWHYGEGATSSPDLTLTHPMSSLVLLATLPRHHPIAENLCQCPDSSWRPTVCTLTDHPAMKLVCGKMPGRCFLQTVTLHCIVETCISHEFSQCYTELEILPWRQEAGGVVSTWLEDDRPGFRSLPWTNGASLSSETNCPCFGFLILNKSSLS